MAAARGPNADAVRPSRTRRHDAPSHTQPCSLTLAHPTAMAGTHLPVAIHPSQGVPAPRPPLTLPRLCGATLFDEDFDRVAKEMADATNQWKKLDDHAQLMDPNTKPPDSNGHPYIPGAAMFESKTINAGTVCLSERKGLDAGARRTRLSQSWCATRPTRLSTKSKVRCGGAHGRARVHTCLPARGWQDVQWRISAGPPCLRSC